MKVVVTGATGFLGKNVVDFLHESGFEVTTLGGNSSDHEIPDTPWTLGMYPDPHAMANASVLVHLGWITRERSSIAYHRNVGGSQKLFEAAKLSGTHVINISSLSAINPVSDYGSQKLEVELLNTAGLNLRLGKVEHYPSVGHRPFWNRFLPVPTSNEILVHVLFLNAFLEELSRVLRQPPLIQTMTLISESCSLQTYLQKYHHCSSIKLPIKFLDLVFTMIRLQNFSHGNRLYDRWLSLKSTPRVL